VVRVCTEFGCGAWVEHGGRCPRHRTPDLRPSAARRGYGSRWRANRARFLQANPICVDCGFLATVPDHDPVSRAELIRQGDPDPDAWHHLKPRCATCHNRRTATVDGKFGR
jgi:5-methylcytosine-specific restriction protein A